MDNPDKVAGTQDTRQRQTKQNNRTQYVLDTAIVKTMKNKQNNRTQYVLDTAIVKTMKNKLKQNTKGVGHHYSLDTTIRNQTLIT